MRRLLILLMILLTACVVIKISSPEQSEISGIKKEHRKDTIK